MKIEFPYVHTEYTNTSIVYSRDAKKALCFSSCFTKYQDYNISTMYNHVGYFYWFINCGLYYRMEEMAEHRDCLYMFYCGMYGAWKGQLEYLSPAFLSTQLLGLG